MILYWPWGRYESSNIRKLNLRRTLRNRFNRCNEKVLNESYVALEESDFYLRVSFNFVTYWMKRVRL